jgi:hypothetical protein
MTETTETETASLTEEIRLLVDMVVEHAAPWLDGVISAGHGSPRPEAENEDCGWCPLCAIVAVVRGERPEFVARVLEHAAKLVALLRAVLADRWEPEQGVHMPGFQPPPREPKTDRVQHISVRWRENG